MTRPGVHHIGYAYPSSKLAVQMRKSRSGCYYVETRDVLKPFPTYATALTYAQTLGTTPSWDSKDHPDNAQFLPSPAIREHVAYVVLM